MSVEVETKEDTKVSIKDRAIAFVQPVITFWEASTVNKLVVAAAAYFLYKEFGDVAYGYILGIPDMASAYVCGGPVEGGGVFSGTLQPDGSSAPQESF